MAFRTRRLILLSVAAIAVSTAVVWLVGMSTPVISLPEVNNVLADRGEGRRSFRCQSPAPETAAEAAVRATEAEFYEAIIRAAPHTSGGNPLVVERLTIQVPAHRRFEKWDPDAAGLLLDGVANCVGLSRDQFPQGVTFIDTADVQDYVKPTRAAVVDVRRQVFAFSRARFDEAQRHAVVYYDRFCFSCGIGEYVWFRRDHPGARWRVAGREWGWIN